MHPPGYMFQHELQNITSGANVLVKVLGVWLLSSIPFFNVTEVVFAASLQQLLRVSERTSCKTSSS